MGLQICRIGYSVPLRVSPATNNPFIVPLQVILMEGKRCSLRIVIYIWKGHDDDGQVHVVSDFND